MVCKLIFFFHCGWGIFAATKCTWAILGWTFLIYDLWNSLKIVNDASLSFIRSIYKEVVEEEKVLA